MTPHLAEPQRPDGWIAAFVVEVVFDTNLARTDYDHVGTDTRCSVCGERLNLDGSLSVLVRHARSHEAQLTGHPVERPPATVGDPPDTSNPSLPCGSRR